MPLLQNFVFSGFSANCEAVRFQSRFAQLVLDVLAEHFAGQVL